MKNNDLVPRLNDLEQLLSEPVIAVIFNANREISTGDIAELARSNYFSGFRVSITLCALNRRYNGLVRNYVKIKGRKPMDEATTYIFDYEAFFKNYSTAGGDKQKLLQAYPTLAESL